MKAKKIVVFGIMVFIYMIPELVFSQVLGGDLGISKTVNQTRVVIRTVSTIVPGICGFLGFCYAGWEFAHSDPKATTHTLAAVVAIGLALLANTFI